MDYIQPILPQLCDHLLEAAFVTEALKSHGYYNSVMAEQPIAHT
jgi:hypothetical protein